jgi:hypothetical protein
MTSSCLEAYNSNRNAAGDTQYEGAYKLQTGLVRDLLAILQPLDASKGNSAACDAIIERVQAHIAGRAANQREYEDRCASLKEELFASLP